MTDWTSITAYAGPRVTLRVYVPPSEWRRLFFSPPPKVKGAK